MNEIVVIGGGGHAGVLISILKKLNTWKIVGYTDIVDKGSILGIQYLGDDVILEKDRNKYKKCSAVIGLGILSLLDINKRIEIKERLEKFGYNLPPIVSPSAVINENVNLGKATVVFDNVVINTGTKIGENVIVNTSSSIDHDCQIESNVHIAPGVTLSGGVVVGNKSFIGAGASIIHNINICDNCIIGAGAVVTRDCSKPGKYVGVPARLLKNC